MQVTPFIQLVRIAIGRLEPDSFTPCDDGQWEEIFQMAKQQAVIGLVYRGMMMLPAGKQPISRTKVKIAVVAEKIQLLNGKLTACAQSLCSDLGALGLNSCILKGQGTALYHDDPSLRQCGDIDVWVDGERDEVIRKLKSRWKTGKVFYHHIEVMTFGKNPEVEVHFTPSWMNNPFVNRKLQRYFKAQAPDQFPRMTAEGFPMPNLTFNLVFNLIHIYRHLLFEGIGMRQLVDYYYMLLRSDESQRDEARRYFAEFRMERFSGAVAYVLRELFDIDASINIAQPSAKYGEQFLEEIFRSGNFGKYDSRNSGINQNSAPVRFVRRMKRLVDFAMAYPSEVFWAPYFKIKQYLWRTFLLIK